MRNCYCSLSSELWYKSPHTYILSSFSTLHVEWFRLDLKHQTQERSKNAKANKHSSCTQHERSYPRKNLKYAPSLTLMAADRSFFH